MMSLTQLKNSEIKKVLVVTLSNIGDVILTCPVIDILKEQFPQAKISIVVGPKSESLFKGNPHFDRILVFDKRAPWGKAIALVNLLRKEKFDLAVDLRNTAIPFLIFAKYRTSPFDYPPKSVHMKEKHLSRLRSVVNFKQEAKKKCALTASAEDKKFADDFFAAHIGINNLFVAVGPGAADQRKRWSEDGFAQVCDELIKQYKVKIVFVGDAEDAKIADRIRKKMYHLAVHLAGKTTLLQLAAVLQKVALVISNDSACMHLASYFDVPTIGLFGPTDAGKYGPWATTKCLIKSKEACFACLNPKDSQIHTCMQLIKSEDVLEKIEFISNGFTLKP